MLKLNLRELLENYRSPAGCSFSTLRNNGALYICHSCSCMKLSASIFSTFLEPIIFIFYSELALFPFPPNCRVKIFSSHKPIHHWPMVIKKGIGVKILSLRYFAKVDITFDVSYNLCNWYGWCFVVIRHNILKTEMLIFSLPFGLPVHRYITVLWVLEKAFNQEVYYLD